MTATDKLAGIKPGDRVRVTFEAEVASKNGRFSKIFGQHDDVCFSIAAMKEPTFHIERLEKPLEVGDRVFWVGPSRLTPNAKFELSGHILAIAQDHAMISRDDLPPVVIDLRLLERIA